MKDLSAMLDAAMGGDSQAMVELALAYRDGDGEKPNHARAFLWLSRAAEAGNAHGMALLGECYENGTGTKTSLQTAATWYRKAYEGGDALGAYRLGQFYERYADNAIEAFACYKFAADHGNPEAQYDVAMAYETGQGTAVDEEASLDYLKKSAEGGYGPAENDLGIRYYRGAGVVQSTYDAHMWLRRSAEHGCTVGMASLGYLLNDPGNVEFHRPEEAYQWFMKAVEGGNQNAAYGLALCYFHGDGVEQDYDKAFLWFGASAEYGDPDGQRLYGECFYYGNGTLIDYDAALTWFRKAAEQGSGKAMVDIGACYDFGEGVDFDGAKALEWYTKAAEAGEPSGYYWMGLTYEEPEGAVEQDLKKAAECYLKGAELDDKNCQYRLSLCYLAGRGVPRSDKLALKWLRNAAEQGVSDAELDLGSRYINGRGIEESAEQAAYWYERAASHGNATAQYFLGSCYFNGEGVPEDKIKARDWYMKSAEQGYTDAQLDLAIMYNYGQGIPVDEKKAVYWFRKAAEQGEPIAQYDLANCYFDGFGVAESKKTAVSWYRKAADQGYDRAQYCLGGCYRDGEGVKKDLKKAAELFTLAAEQGFALAQAELGVAYLNGDGVEQDAAKAVEWFTKAAEQGDVDAQFNLVVCYDEGRGVEKNPDKAFYWCQRAAEQGLPQALWGLGVCYDEGEGVEKDEAKAAYWFGKASEADLPLGHYDFARMLAQGKGVKKDQKRALELYQKAIEGGVTEAEEDKKALIEEMRRQAREEIKASAAPDVLVLCDQKDLPKAKRLCRELSAEGLHAVDGIDARIDEGFSWYLENAKSFIVLLPEGKPSDYLNQEILAIQSRINEGTIDSSCLRFVAVGSLSSPESGGIKPASLPPSALQFSVVGSPNEAERLVFGVSEDVWKHLVSAFRERVKNQSRELPFLDGAEANDLPFLLGLNEGKLLDDKGNERPRSALFEADIAFLSGSAGTGKTTYVKNAIRLDEDPNALYFYFPARELCSRLEAHRLLIDVLAEELRAQEGASLRFIRHELISRREPLHLIYDGYDELTDKEKERLVSASRHFMLQRRKLSLLVVSRYPKDSDGLKRYEYGAPERFRLEPNVNPAFFLAFTKGLPDENPVQKALRQGFAYYLGLGVAKDCAKAFESFEEADGLGSPEASYCLGYLYERGIGTEKDLPSALAHYDKAYRAGLRSAKKPLDLLQDIVAKEEAKLEVPEDIDVFLSWFHNDQTFKNRLVGALEEEGYHVFDSDKRAKGYLNPAIRSAVYNAKGYVVILTEEAVERSGYMPVEIDWMFERIKSENLSSSLIKIHVNGDPKKIYAAIEARKEKGGFKRLLDLAADFEKDVSTSIENTVRFAEESVRAFTLLRYRRELRERYVVFPVALSDIITKNAGGEVNASLRYEDGYIERDLIDAYGNRIAPKDALSVPSLFIHGEGGSGKSLFVRNLLRRYSDESRLFFLLPCGSLRKELEKGSDLFAILASTCLRFNLDYQHLPKDFLFNVFRNRALSIHLIFDALDEAGGEEDKKNVLGLINDLGNLPHREHIHYVFTSRNKDDESLIFSALGNPPLTTKVALISEAQIARLFDAFYERNYGFLPESGRRLGQEEGDKRSRVSREDFLRCLPLLAEDVKNNPLLISNLIYIYFATRKLQTERAFVLEQSSEIMVRYLENERGTLATLTEPLKTLGIGLGDLLENVAWDLSVNEGSSLEDAVQNYLSSKLGDSREEDVEAICKGLRGRRIIRGDDFNHGIYRSYFAARYVYGTLYQKSPDEFKETHLTFLDGGEKRLEGYVSRYFSEDDGLWPDLTLDFVCKIDYEVHGLRCNKKGLNRSSPSCLTFKTTLESITGEDGMGDIAYTVLCSMVKQSGLLYYPDYIASFLKRNRA